MDKDIVISVKVILFTLLFGLGVFVLFRLGVVIGILIISFLMAISFEVSVKSMMKQKLMNTNVSRPLAVLTTYLLAILIFVLAGTIIIPPVVSQAQVMLQSLNGLTRSLNLSEGFDVSLAELIPEIKAASGGVLSAALSIFGNFALLISVLILSIYISLDWENIKLRFAELFSSKYSNKITGAIEEVEVNIGHWVKGQLFLMFVIGLFSYLGLILLDVKFPLALGLISGVLEIIPVLGPIIATVFAAVVAIADSPIKALGVVVLYFVIQQLESNILVPKVMQRVSGFSPLMILIALLIGNNLFGIIGAITAVPILMILTTIVKKFLL